MQSSIEKCRQEFIESGSCSYSASERSESAVIEVLACDTEVDVRAFFDLEERRYQENNTAEEDRNKFCKENAFKMLIKLSAIEIRFHFHTLR